ncbi:MAG TPA: sugar phosphate isomerase/epimerase [Armatimonadota bacterium]|nr:sugar phosphate isomerase/epimerase [Armatimonadota bacterium]
MRLACSLSAFAEDRFEIAMAKVAWAGFKAVELSLARELPAGEALRARLRAEEIELAALEAGEAPLGVDDAALEALGGIGRAAALTRALDGGVVVLSAPAEGELPELARALAALHRALGELPVDLCLANRAGTLLSAREELQRLWDHGVPERVGLALDPAQAVLAGWDPLDLDALPELPRHVYLNDLRGGRVVPPGEGELNLSGFAKELRLRGYSGAVTLTLENADPWAVEPIARESRERAEDWFLA